jgi:predicted lipoprotein with Yx(FWY)xxD motif
MNRRITLTVALVGMGAGLAGTAACGRPASADFVVPVAATTYAPPPPAQGPGEPPVQDPGGLTAAGAATSGPDAGSGADAGSPSEGPAGDQPVPEPTVARTQKRVKIYSGPSTTKIKPPASKTKGSHTVELDVTDNPQIGDYLTDGAGRTLYVFDDDSSNPPRSACNGSCAIAWPPLLIKSPGKIYPNGVNPEIIGYVERADHTCQVTVNGHPVYFFVADAKAGDINGQGVNGKWFAVAPNGGRTTAVPIFPSSGNSPAPSSSPSPTR